MARKKFTYRKKTSLGRKTNKKLTSYTLSRGGIRL